MDGYLLPDKVYSVLKWLGLIALPAVSAFIQTCGEAVSWPYTGITVTFVNAFGVLIGALIAGSQAKAAISGGSNE